MVGPWADSAPRGLTASGMYVEDEGGESITCLTPPPGDCYSGQATKSRVWNFSLRHASGRPPTLTNRRCKFPSLLLLLLRKTRLEALIAVGCLRSLSVLVFGSVRLCACLRDCATKRSLVQCCPRWSLR